MKAAVLTKLNAPLELCTLEHGEPQFGQVLVKIHQSGICGAQLAEIRGEKGNERFLPHLLGHEGAGTVLATGQGVSRVKAGDRVVLHWRKADGASAPSPRYTGKSGRLMDTPIGGGPVTTFATEALISENRLTAVHKDTPDDLCALLGCGLSTALGTIENEAKLQMGERVMVIGVGGLGANLILASKLRQASLIAAVDVHDKSEIAHKMGAHFFCQTTSDQLQDLSNFDVVIDTTGNFTAVRDAFRFLAGGGRFIMVGQPRPGASMEIPSARDLFNGEGKTIIATQGGQFRPDRDIGRYVAMHRAGLLNLDGLVTHRLPLEDINVGLDLVRQGQAGRIMIHMP